MPDEPANILDRLAAGGAPPVATHTDEGRPRKQADVLIDIGMRHRVFHDEGGDPYAVINLDGRTAVFRMYSTDYGDWLGREYYGLTGKGANRNAVGDAVATLAAKAKYDGPQEPVYLRVAPTPADGVAIDLGNDSGEAVIVTPQGWRIVQPPVYFRRVGKALALPRPKRSDDAATAFRRLWAHANVDAADRVLAAAWLLGALHPSGPYLILMICGEAGTGKSSTSRALKSLTDPGVAMLRAPPRDEKDMLVAASNAWVLALDNLSGLTPELSDALCRVSTGGALAARKLYTDTDEVLVELQRPMILNGIEDTATRPDLADRCLHLQLPRLPTTLNQGRLARQFEDDAPLIFGAMLDALVLAVRDHRTIKLDPAPRMIDAATWAAAGLPALGYSAAEFVAAYTRNRAEMMETAVEASPVARALVEFMGRHDIWTGTSSTLLTLLSDGTGGSAWPKSPRGLAGSLRRLAPALRAVGIGIEHERSGGVRTVSVYKLHPSAGLAQAHVHQGGAADASAADTERVTL